MDPPEQLGHRETRQGAMQRLNEPLEHGAEVLCGKTLKGSAGFRVHQPDQFQNQWPFPRWSESCYERVQKCMKDLVNAWSARARAPLVLIQKKKALLIDRGQTADDHGLEESLFGPEVIVDRGQVHTGGGNNPANRSAVEAVLGEHPLGDVKNPCARIRHSST
jgi:hypothetical protein